LLSLSQALPTILHTTAAAALFGPFRSKQSCLCCLAKRHLCHIKQHSVLLLLRCHLLCCRCCQ
jgi:hypothetical protein